MHNEPQIAVVVPTIRPKSFVEFKKGWAGVFANHDIELVVVDDTGDEPVIVHGRDRVSLDEVMGKNKDLISNKCAAVRNLGFAYVQLFLPNVEVIMTFDDDMLPNGDPIADHLQILSENRPTSWFPVSEITSRDDYTRGFPYGIREESPVMLSHGVWYKNPDYDAPTQLVKGNVELNYLKCIVPKGLFFPFCGMNVAFRREALPYVYYAPVRDFKGAERFDDIYFGVLMKPLFDKKGWAIATGYSSCIHTRESNVLYNLEKEAVGIRHNESFWKDVENYDEDPFFQEFREKYNRWTELWK